MPTKRKKNTASTKRKRPLTPEEKEDAHDVALIRREIAKGGRSYSLNQVLKEMGFHDLVVSTKRTR